MSTASDLLAAYIAAEQAILIDGQEIRVDGKLYRAADLQQIRDERAKLQLQVNAENAAANRQVGPSFAFASFGNREGCE